MKNMYVLAAWMTSTITFSEAAILVDDQCPVQPPCTCNSDSIFCESKNLTTFPDILPFSNPSAALSLRFDNNHFTDVPADVFRNVSTANAISIRLNLSSNAISSMSENAFVGIENVTNNLEIHSNELSTIPIAISKLTSLESLDLRNNPLTTIEPNILTKIHASLKTFSFSAGKMMSWPNEVQVLEGLTELQVDGIQLKSLPPDAFHGLETTLETLSVSDTGLESIPDSICPLKHLRKFIFDNNRSVKDFSFNNLCDEPLTEMTSLSLNGNKLSTFPVQTFSVFPHLTTLSLMNNQLRYIPSEHVLGNNSITELVLINNQITVISNAVSAFQNLQTLFLSSNQIQGIEHNDLSGLINLQFLSLDYNPIENAHLDVFNDQQSSLVMLSMPYTNLSSIPTATTSLSNLAYLDFTTQTGIECSCDNMGKLRSWDVRSMWLLGQCKTSDERIWDYILNSLPHCP